MSDTARDPYALLRGKGQQGRSLDNGQNEEAIAPVKKVKRWFLRGENGELIEPSLNIDATIIRSSQGLGIEIHPLTTPQLFRK
jgi:hypothetical protein